MFASKKVVNNLIETLGLEKDGKEKDKELYGNPWASVWANTLATMMKKEIKPACSSESIKKIKEDISILDKKLFLLFDYLGIEYQKECKENLPKIKKIKRAK